MSQKTLRGLFGFSASVRNSAMGGTFTACANCGKEKATELDHVLSLDFHMHAERLGVQMDSESNAMPLCGKCHSEKSHAEAWIDPDDFASIFAHWQKWYAKAFTPKGKRRTFRAKTIDARKGMIRVIARAKRNARIAMRKAKEANNPEMAEHFLGRAYHYHKLAAKHRRAK